MNSPVPATLHEAAVAWKAAGRPQQGATEYVRSRWVDALPEHRQLVHALPERLNRSDSRRLIAGLLEEDNIAGAFVVSQIWGYGRRGYGPYRVRRVLDQDGAGENLRAGYDVLHRDGPGAAFSAFADKHRLAWLGPAFFTKFMFFADPTQQSLVLDEYVAAWIREHIGLKLPLYPARSSVYVGYLELVQAWAAMLELTVHEVEQLIFAAEARTRPRNDWLLEDSS